MIASSTLQKIEDIFGKENCSSEPEDILAYGFDATGNESAPECVVFPTSAQQVSDTLRLANEYKFAVTARGAGTGFVGGSIPVHNGVTMVMTRMNRILEIDEENLTATVEPGLVTGKFQEAVEKVGLFYPPDPASLKTSTLGGNVAMGSGGPRAVKYGVTKDYVLALEVVLPDGEIINMGAGTVKSVVGYDFTRLMVGSEGTLGIVTKITLKLLSKPESVRTMLAMFNTVDDAAKTVARIVTSKITPRTLEFMDRASVVAVENYLHAGLPTDVGAILLIETDGTDGVAGREIERISAICKDMGALDTEVAMSEAQREKLWKTRRSMSQAILQIKPTKINEDVTVPRSKIPELIAQLEALSKAVNLPIINFWSCRRWQYSC